MDASKIVPLNVIFFYASSFLKDVGYENDFCHFGI